jgi:hypothetical protein
LIYFSNGLKNVPASTVYNLLLKTKKSCRVTGRCASFNCRNLWLLIIFRKCGNAYSNATETTAKESSEYIGACGDPECEQVESLIAVIIIGRIIRRLIDMIDPIVSSYKPTKCEKIEDWIATFVNWIFVVLSVIIVVSIRSSGTQAREISNNKHSTSHDKVDWNIVLCWTIIFILCP